MRGRPVVATACTGWNHHFEPVELPRFDDLIVRAAGADLKPIKQTVSGGAVYFWAPASDVAEVVLTPGPTPVTGLGPVAVRLPVRNAEGEGDDECRYGEDTFDEKIHGYVHQKEEGSDGRTHAPLRYAPRPPGTVAAPR